MAHFSLKITGQRLAVTQVVIASDTTDYLTGEVSVTPDWDDAELWVNFKKDEEIHSVIVEEGVIPADKHINLTAGVWQVWCLGLKYEEGEVVQRITTTVCTITVNRTGGLGGDPFPETGDSPVAQLLAKIAEANANAAEAKEDSVTALTRANSAAADVDRRGVPSGGEPGYCLVKSSGAEYETAWVPSSNPYNLLDNSDFTNPVNQRGQTDYTTSVGQTYTIDRWIKRGSTTTPVMLSPDGLTVTNNGSSSYVAIKQAVADDRFSPAGKTVTAAVKIKSLSGTGRLRISGGSVAAGDTSIYKQATFSKTGVFVISCTIPDTLSHEFFGVAVTAEAGSSVTLEWAALYEGEYTTETLPVYQPKGYGAELAECQRYQYVISPYTPVYGCLNGTKTILYLALPVPVTMRTKPVITNLSVIGVRTNNGGNVTPEITSFSVDECTPQTVTLGVNTAAFNTNTYAGNTPVFAYINSGLLDANL